MIMSVVLLRRHRNYPILVFYFLERQRPGLPKNNTRKKPFSEWRILGADKWEPEREALEHEVTYAAMPAGSVLVSRGGLLHAAGANVTSNDWRVGVFMSYTLGWLRQEENLYVDVPPEVAIGFPKDVRAILGCESLSRFNYSIIIVRALHDYNRAIGRATVQMMRMALWVSLTQTRLRSA